MSDLQAYLRDASWIDQPSTSGSKQYHLESLKRQGLTACGVGVILDDLQVRRADEVPEWSRCRRNGCRQRWPDPSP